MHTGRYMKIPTTMFMFLYMFMFLQYLHIHGELRYRPIFEDPKSCTQQVTDHIWNAATRVKSVKIVSMIFIEHKNFILFFAKI